MWSLLPAKQQDSARQVRGAPTNQKQAYHEGRGNLSQSERLGTRAESNKNAWDDDVTLKLFLVARQPFPPFPYHLTYTLLLIHLE